MNAAFIFSRGIALLPVTMCAGPETRTPHVPHPQSRIGKTESHGCIRMTNWSALAVADAVVAGTPVELQE
ncbi:MAG: L,D-transpeptidase family protein [Xanthomonadales bacterium]|nr:L,D-transpeptidase family protein [Xanthomonadales bacterium]